MEGVSRDCRDSQEPHPSPLVQLRTGGLRVHPGLHQTDPALSTAASFRPTLTLPVPADSQLAQKVHYSSLVPHLPLIISQHKQKAEKTLSEKAEGKRVCPEASVTLPDWTRGLFCSAALGALCCRTAQASVTTPEHLQPESQSSASACSGCKDRTAVLAGAAQPSLGVRLGGTATPPSAGDGRARGCGADLMPIGSAGRASASQASPGFPAASAQSSLAPARAGSVSIWDCHWVLIPGGC